MQNRFNTMPQTKPIHNNTYTGTHKAICQWYVLSIDRIDRALDRRGEGYATFSTPPLMNEGRESLLPILTFNLVDELTPPPKIEGKH